MCRLLGVVSSEVTEFRILLRETPRSLAALSREHRDGWGIAVYGGEPGTWTIRKGVACASEDTEFHEHAVGSQGVMMVSHIRQKTVGPTCLSNTHPFRKGRWVFAHNGTVKDQEYLRSQASPERLAEVHGDTDSELLFAVVLTRLDRAGVAASAATAATDRALGAIARELAGRPDFGACNFLLSDGDTLYAHRLGRTLFLLERGPEDTARERRSSRDGTVVETPFSSERSDIFVASEHMTDEPWQPIDEGTLIRVDRTPSPRWVVVSQAPAVDPEQRIASAS